MKKINENTKVTLTFGQLKKLVKESNEDNIPCPSCKGTNIDIDSDGNATCLDCDYSWELKDYTEGDPDSGDWCVVRLGGSIGDKSTCRIGGDKCSVQKDGLTKDEAKDLAREYRKMTSPGDRKYYGITYKAVPMSKVRCGVEEAAQDVLPEEVIVEFEDHLRAAQKEVEAAARLVCSSHNKAARQSWNALYRLSEDIANVIHSAYKFGY